MSSLLNAPEYDERREKRRTKLLWIVVVIVLVLLGTAYWMRNWTYAGAEGVLRLRAAVQEGSYARLWQQRLRPAA